MNVALTIPETAAGIVLTAAAVAAAGYLLRVAWKATRTAWTLFRRLVSALEAVEAQLYPNGGHTLRDAVNRIQHRLGIEDIPPEDRT